MNLKLILADSTQITLNDGNFINRFTTICNSREQVFYLWQKLDPSVTNQVKIMLDNEIIQIISNIVIDGMEIKEDTENNIYIVTFTYYGALYSRDIEKENTDIARILLGEV